MVSVQNGSKIIMCKEKPLNYSGVVQNFSLVVLECLDEQILDNLLRKFFVAQEAEDCSSGLPLNQNLIIKSPWSSAVGQREKMSPVIFQLETLSNISHYEIGLILKCHDVSFLNNRQK